MNYQVCYLNGGCLLTEIWVQIIEIEASAIPTGNGKGTLIVTGIVDEEELVGRQKNQKKKYGNGIGRNV
jgi:Lon-like ATP-dependent protease